MANKISVLPSVFTILKLFVIFSITFSLFIIVQYYGFQPSNWKTLDVNQEINFCPMRPPDLMGPFDPDVTSESMESIDERLKSDVKPGGYYKPTDCTARYRVAVLVPCRGKELEKLIPVLMKNLHPMMMRQQLEYQIFIVSQTHGHRFNKGAVLNAGFLEAMKIRHWDCVIFHDVDTIPMDDRNLYDCPRANPRHLSVDIDKFNFT